MSPKTALVIDSDHEARVQIRKALEDAGHFVVSASSGAEALLLLEKTSVPALIFTSFNALMMSGEHILDLLRTQERFAKIPAVQIRHPDDKDLPGVCESISKPYSSDSVITALKHCL